jgi:predicted transcriptional regulator
MSKIAASTRLAPEVMQRLDLVAKVDRRSYSEVIEVCVEEYLPVLEAEMEAKKKALDRIKSDRSEGKQRKKVA